jgi:hypothetical protein
VQYWHCTYVAMASDEQQVMIDVEDNDDNVVDGVADDTSSTPSASSSSSSSSSSDTKKKHKRGSKKDRESEIINRGTVAINRTSNTNHGSDFECE